MEQFDSNLSSVIDSTLGMRCRLYGYQYSEIIRHAVKGMLPDGKLGRQMFKKLKVYAGPEHAHAAQKPETWEF